LKAERENREKQKKGNKAAASETGWSHDIILRAVTQLNAAEYLLELDLLELAGRYVR